MPGRVNSYTQRNATQRNATQRNATTRNTNNFADSLFFSRFEYPGRGISFSARRGFFIFQLRGFASSEPLWCGAYAP
jgi:hypothetical protein